MNWYCSTDGMDIAKEMTAIGVAARAASILLGGTGAVQRDLALCKAAALLRANVAAIQAANDDDLSAAKSRGMSAAMLDRLKLDAERIEAMATGLETVAKLPDPVGRILAEWDRPNGLRIQRVAVPLGQMADVRSAIDDRVDRRGHRRRSTPPRSERSCRSALEPRRA